MADNDCEPTRVPGHLRLVEPDPEWPSRFAAELLAKPILDIAVAVSDEQSATPAVALP